MNKQERFSAATELAAEFSLTIGQGLSLVSGCRITVQHWRFGSISKSLADLREDKENEPVEYAGMKSSDVQYLMNN